MQINFQNHQTAPQKFDVRKMRICAKTVLARAD